MRGCAFGAEREGLWLWLWLSLVRLVSFEAAEEDMGSAPLWLLNVLDVLDVLDDSYRSSLGPLGVGRLGMGSSQPLSSTARLMMVTT